MRLFIAIEIGPAIAAAAAVLIEQLRARAVQLAPRSRVTWVAADRLHITVRFIGHVDDARAALIRDTISVPLPCDPFELTLSGVGTFPPKGSPRVVWVAVSTGRDQLAQIEQLVSQRLLAIGIAPEDRPYNPHVTLGRVRDAAGLRSSALLAELDDVDLGATRVSAITLFESRLSPKGPEYIALQRADLRFARS